MTQPIVDAEFAALIPPLQADELTQLEANIVQDGCREPLSVWAGYNILLDGHNRLTICNRHSLPFKTVDIALDSRDDAMLWIISNQMGRRNLPQIDMIGLIEAREPILARKAKANQALSQGRGVKGLQNSANLIAPIDTRAESAKLAGVSHYTYDAGKKVRAAVASGALPADTIDKIRMHEESISGAAKKMSKDEKRKKKQTERIKSNVSIDSHIIVGDMREVGLQVESNSIDMIFTDPPYPEEFLPLWGSLSEFAARVLKPGGLCLAYSGQIFLPDTLRLLGKDLEYLWTFAIRHAGGNQRIFKVNVNTGWKPILCFVKPPLDIWWDSFIDITSGEREKDLHEWQQAESEAAYFIEKICPAGSVVLDPFAGSGTTLVAAKKLNMRYIGIEINPDDAQRATVRLSK